MKSLLLLLAAGAALAGCAVYPAGYDGYGYGYGYPAYGSVNVYGTYGDREGGRHYRHDRDRNYDRNYDRQYGR